MTNTRKKLEDTFQFSCCGLLSYVFIYMYLSRPSNMLQHYGCVFMFIVVFVNIFRFFLLLHDFSSYCEKNAYSLYTLSL